jgi:hypothetical protein
MRMHWREARIAPSNFSHALIAMAMLIALFAVFLLAHANKNIDCSWRNQSKHSAHLASGVDWRCADNNSMNTRQ